MVIILASASCTDICCSAASANDTRVRCAAAVLDPPSTGYSHGDTIPYTGVGVVHDTYRHSRVLYLASLPAIPARSTHTKCRQPQSSCMLRLCCQFQTALAAQNHYRPSKPWVCRQLLTCIRGTAWTRGHGQLSNILPCFHGSTQHWGTTLYALECPTSDAATPGVLNHQHPAMACCCGCRRANAFDHIQWHICS
jgi:hypothetical protein